MVSDAADAVDSILDLIVCFIKSTYLLLKYGLNITQSAGTINFNTNRQTTTDISCFSEQQAQHTNIQQEILSHDLLQQAIKFNSRKHIYMADKQCNKYFTSRLKSTAYIINSITYHFKV